MNGTDRFGRGACWVIHYWILDVGCVIFIPPRDRCNFKLRLRYVCFFVIFHSLWTCLPMFYFIDELSVSSIMEG